MNFKATVMVAFAFANEDSAAFIRSGLGSSSALSIMAASSARSTSTSEGVSLSSSSATSLCAADLCIYSFRTPLRGSSFLCASWSCVDNLANSLVAWLRAASLSKRLKAACFALMKMRASPSAFCASETACSVCMTACLTSVISSPAAAIISEVITAFSTESSARSVFDWASGRISLLKTVISFTSASRCFEVTSTLVFAARTLASSEFTDCCAVLSCAIAMFIRFATSGVVPRCFSTLLFIVALSAVTWGASNCSACFNSSGSLRSPMRVFASSTACFAVWMASSMGAVTAEVSWDSGSRAGFCPCATFRVTVTEGRTGPSQGIFQPAIGGVCVSAELRDQTCWPPT
mmetsp:Transcript_63313/g.176125  ORF Transcript_63313/g.176125 Transcript_63313/m.176125 type:complete len:348 (-) Transcript_63313:463-1506(-)